MEYLTKEQRDLLATAIAYGLQQPDMTLVSDIYEKALTTVGDTLVESGIVTDRVYVDLKRDLRAKQSQLLRIAISNVATEIVHSMNRKSLIANDDVDDFIKKILEVREEH